jgi:2-oxoglutarate ferredoxin oxidoreductase subunit gamma
MLKEIRIAGFGGQGVILSANVMGRACALYSDGFATMMQSFGPEARGGAASATLVLSDEPVLYPYVGKLDVLVVMSQEAYTRFAAEVKPGGYMLVEEDLVRLSGIEGDCKVFSIPATRLAEELGKKMILNVVMVGFAAAVTKVVDPEACKKAVADLVPSRFRDLNLSAFDKGYEYGYKLVNCGVEKTESGHAVEPVESIS